MGPARQCRLGRVCSTDNQDSTMSPLLCILNLLMCKTFPGLHFHPCADNVMNYLTRDSNEYSRDIRWRDWSLDCCHANLSRACWMKSSISSIKAGQQSSRLSRAVMNGWGFLLQCQKSERTQLSTTCSMMLELFLVRLKNENSRAAKLVGVAVVTLSH